MHTDIYKQAAEGSQLTCMIHLELSVRSCGFRRGGIHASHSDPVHAILDLYYSSLVLVCLQVVGLKWYNMQGERWMEPLQEATPVQASTRGGADEAGRGRAAVTSTGRGLDRQFQLHLNSLQVGATAGCIHRRLRWPEQDAARFTLPGKTHSSGCCMCIIHHARFLQTFYVCKGAAQLACLG